MASDKKKSSTASTGNGGSVPRSKRPGRTIDLEAEDVTVEDAPAKETSQASGKTAQASSGKKPDEPGDDAASSDAKASSSPRGQSSWPVEIKRFGTHLAAGLAGGLIGVVGAAILFQPAPVETVKPYDDTPIAERLKTVETSLAGLPVDNAPLEKRLGAVETQLSALPKGDPAADVRETARKLQARVSDLENKPPAQQPEIKGFASRIGKLEDILKTLREAGEQEGASGIEQSAALTGKIAEVSTHLENRIKGLSADIDVLKKTLDAQSTDQTRISSKAVSELSSRLGGINRNIAALEEKVSTSAALSGIKIASSDGGAALTLAYEGLRRTIDRGRPYAGQLNALAKIARGTLDISKLEADALGGISTRADLLSALPKILKAAHAAIEAPEDKTLLDRIVTNARSVVRIRRIGPSEGDRPQQVLSRMEAQMKALNLEGVLSAAGGLKGAALEPVQPWINKARARLEIEDHLDAMGTRLIDALQAKPENKG